MDYPWPVYGNELTHHGVKGQKWGIRRYQNEDGTLTFAGKRKYKKETKVAKQILTRNIKADSKILKLTANRVRKFEKKLDKADASGNEAKSQKIMKKLTKDYTAGKSIAETIIQNKKFLKDIDEGTLLAGRDFTAYKKRIIVPTPFMTVVRTKGNVHFYSNDEKEQLRKKGKLRS